MYHCNYFYSIWILDRNQKVKLFKGLPKYYTGRSKNVVTDNIIMFCQSETNPIFHLFHFIRKTLKN